MRRARWACSSRLAVALAALLLAVLLARGVGAVPLEAGAADVIAAEDAVPPAEDDARWRRVALPDAQPSDHAWYRIRFERPAGRSGELWMVYLPFFYGGGQVWVNDALIAQLQERSEGTRVRWERPFLLPVPAALLHDGANVLHLRAASAHMPSGTGAPRVLVGAQRELQPLFDRRLFFVRTVPLVTVVGGGLVGLFVLFIWWRRRSELLYGLFGLAALMWAMRTTTFIFDTLPADWWSLWRLMYHLSTGMFIIVLALFSLGLAGWLRPRVMQALLAYALLGPAAYLAGRDNAEELVGRWWTAGLIPIGLGLLCVSVVAAWRRRSAGSVALALALAIAVATGIHDYLVAWRSPLIAWLAPSWSDHRIFLLHHGANLVLVVMGALLTSRFVRSLQEVEEMNRTLESRVAEREREIAATYERIAALQREQAATDERQRIMRDLHDGLGSRLFTSLLQVERGALPPTGVAEVLRGCIADMRLAIEALVSDDQDFRTALGNFLFRWEAPLRDAGITPRWRIEVPDATLPVAPHTALQLLRLLQEALTNVLKHARAGQVEVSLELFAGALRLCVQDDGRGFEAGAPSAGRGLVNMHARAQRIGAQLSLETRADGTRITVTLPRDDTPLAAAA